MRPAPLPVDEALRRAALASFEILDSVPEEAFDTLVSLAAQICEVPIALLSLVDAERQWFKARVGFQATETPRDQAFCAHAILDPERVLEVTDTLADPRFSGNPLVLGEPAIRFYAGAPIVTSDGHAIGTLCAIDRVPRRLESTQVAALESLARLAAQMLEHRRFVQREVERATEDERQELDRLFALVTHGGEITALVDKDHVFRAVNESYLSYWKKERDEVLGRRVVDVFGLPALDPATQDHLRRAFDGEIVAYNATVDFPSVGRRHMQVSLLPAVNRSGETIGAVVRLTDMTELVERSEQLAATAARLTEHVDSQQRFIHMLSHDLREPINSIVNFATALEEDHATDMPVEACALLARVLGGGRRMKTLLDALVELMRLDDQNVALEEVALEEVAGEVIADLAAAIERTGAHVRFDSLPSVLGERSLLRVLAQNLIANAIKFTLLGEIPRVHISASTADGEVELRIQDAGIGIEAAQLESVFEVFYRGHARKRYEGTGLGLAICRKIAEIHRARIWITSEAGHGTCVHVAFRAPTSA